MKRKRRVPAHANHERWLVSYADFITLLFAFFVVLYSSSQVDKRKVGKLAMAIQVAFQELGVFPSSTSQVPVNSAEPMPFNTVQAIENVERTAAMDRIVPAPKSVLGGSDGNSRDLSGLERHLQKSLAPQIGRREVVIHQEFEGLVISLKEIGFFDSGSASLRPSSRAAVGEIAALLEAGNYRIRIEGHTDDVPIHNSRFSSNWELSTARATELVQVLVTRHGFAPERLSAAGYAEFHPVAANDTDEGRALNRRVDIVVLGRDAMQTSASPYRESLAPTATSR
jgi:chemotaxis protein MotB